MDARAHCSPSSSWSPLYVAIATADLAGWVKLGSLVLLATFSLVYILLVRQVVESPLSTRVLTVGLLMLLTLPQFLVIGTSATALWIFVAVAGGLLFRDAVAMVLGRCAGRPMLLVDVLAGEPPAWELALTLVAITAFMVGFVRQRQAEPRAAGAPGSNSRSRRSPPKGSGSAGTCTTSSVIR